MKNNFSELILILKEMLSLARNEEFDEVIKLETRREKLISNLDLNNIEYNSIKELQDMNNELLIRCDEYKKLLQKELGANKKKITLTDAYYI